MLRQGESYELTGSNVIATTPKVVLVRLDDETKRWIPRSVLIDGDSLSEDDDDVAVLAWWAEQKGIL